MSRIDATVLRETRWICGWLLALSAVMELVFLCLGRWDLTVLWGNLLGAGTAALNFFLMALTVQKALNTPEKNRAGLMRLSQLLRLLMQGGALVLGVQLKCFHTVAAILPLFFPQLPIRLRPFLEKRKASGGEDDGSGT